MNKSSNRRANSKGKFYKNQGEKNYMKKKFRVESNQLGNKQFIREMGKSFMYYEKELANSILAPNPSQLAKFEVVEHTLRSIAKEHINAKVNISKDRDTCSRATLRTSLLTTEDFQMLASISNLLSAISIDATLDGIVEVGVTVPDTYLIVDINKAQ